MAMPHVTCRMVVIRQRDILIAGYFGGFLILTFFLIHSITTTLALEAELALALCSLLLVVNFHGLDGVALRLVNTRFEHHGVLLGSVVLLELFAEGGFDALPNLWIDVRVCKQLTGRNEHTDVILGDKADGGTVRR